MLAENEIRKTKEEFGGTKEWTLMFYFASDNPLAISIVSQLKAIKAAGFHHEANVIVQFDPYTEGTPTHIFDVNAVNKVRQEEPNIGFDGEPFVPTLIEDRLWRNETNETGEKIRDLIEKVLRERHNLHYKARTAPELNGNGNAPPADENAASKTVDAKGGAVDTTGTTTADTKSATVGTKGTATAGTKGAAIVGTKSAASVETTLAANFATQIGTANGGSKDGRRRRRKRQELDPRKSLEEFLKFCRENYKARHYMLFILGHGVVVGNDVFLYDEHAEEHSISLNEMGDVLTSFREELDKMEATFELVSFHSCSVSSLEVAYQLKNTANYFLASQGPQFVGSWPYRAILMRIFKDLMTEPTSGDIRAAIRKIFKYCFDNSDDFLLAGYSYQLTLCDLRNIDSLNDKLQNLSNALYDAMFKEDADSLSIVLYSHWKAQGFFQEMYTDLYDFCFCIMERCQQISGKRPLSDPLAAIWKACTELTEVLQKRADTKDDETAFVLAADFAGPAYQYSRGMSVYFPWSRPSADSDIMEQYEDYDFHTQFHADQDAKGGPRKSWRDFLEEYFNATQRVPRGTELLWELPNAQKAVKLGRDPNSNDEQLLNEDVRTLIYNGEGPLGGSLAKDDPRDRTGEECSCASFKNYPRDTRPRKVRKQQATPVKKVKSAAAAQST
jgi:hypothetical protein